MNYPKFVLASASPRRRELLEAAGLEFDVVPSTIDEVIDSQLPPAEGALKVAREKAAAVLSLGLVCPVLAADTIVVLRDESVQPPVARVLGKPDSLEDARNMLRLLRGRAHTVFTAFAWVWGGAERDCVISSEVRFRQLDDLDINRYLLTTEWKDKAGAYAAQGLGVGLIQEINGSLTNVIGLPVSEVLRDYSLLLESRSSLENY